MKITILLSILSVLISRVDAHELIASFAPHPVLISSGEKVMAV